MFLLIDISIHDAVSIGDHHKNDSFLPQNCFEFREFDIAQSLRHRAICAEKICCSIVENTQEQHSKSQILQQHRRNCVLVLIIEQRLSFVLLVDDSCHFSEQIFDINRISVWIEMRSKIPIVNDQGNFIVPSNWFHTFLFLVARISSPKK